MWKKLIILEDSSKVKFGGGQKGTLEIIELFEKEKNIFIFDCSSSSIFQRKLKSFKKVKRYALKCAGKIVNPVESSFSIGFTEIILSFFYFPINIYKIVNFLKRNHFHLNETIFYTSSKKLLLILYILKKIFGINYIFHARTFDNVKNKFFYLIKPALLNANKVIAVSELIKDNLSFLNNVEVIYNSIKLPKKVVPRYFSNKDKFIVAFVGELIPWKGIDVFIKSFSYLKDAKIYYYIYGTSKMEEKYKKLAMKLGKNIIFKGFVDNMENEYKDVIDLLVSPSISPESFGRTVIEAASYGIPVIASDTGAPKFFIEKGKFGYIYKSKDPKQLANLIESIVNNKNKYETYSMNAIKFSMNFSFNKFQEKIKRCFNESITIR